MRRRTALVILAVILAATLAACASKPAPEETAAATAPTGMDDPTATGEMLLRQWLDALKGPDTDLEALEEFMAPNFQLVRDDATRANREEYLAEPATVHGYEIAEVRALADDTGGAATITVDFQLTVDATIDGQEVSTTAPRLSTFVWNGDHWTVLSWANFGVIEEDPAPTMSPSPVPEG